MKNTILFILFLSLAIFSGSSFASGTTLFGPNNYVRTTGAADIYNSTFTASVSEARLVVKNGCRDEKLKINNATSSASVVINGEEIFEPNDFNQKVHLLEKLIDLKENNSITIEMTSNPGSFLTIEIVGESGLATVSINTSVESIQAGESLTLSWSSTNADSCSIEPGIGLVYLNGSMAVSPAVTTTYTITATGPGGTAIDEVTVTIISGITLDITSPETGGTIFRPNVMIQGTISNETGNETGVTVNGVTAIVYGNHFCVNHVTLQEGANTITANAMDIEGNTAVATISLNADITGNHVDIIVGSEMGIAPLETGLTIDASFHFSDSSIICPDTGVEIIASDSPEEYRAQVLGEGLYLFTVHVADNYNIVHTDTVAVMVMDRTELDELLRKKWDGMKTSLINGDIEVALNYFQVTSREHFRKVFTLLTNRIADIALAMREIEMITADEKIAKYRIRKEMIIQEETHDITYYIYFNRDSNGLWHLENM